MKQGGLSLIELLVVIALFGLFSVAGMSFTDGWVDSNRVMAGENMMVQAYGIAKATALRNEHGKTGDNAAAALCIANNVISVREATTAAAASCSTTLAWSATVNARLSITADNTAVTCACLNNQGLLTTTGCNSCLATNAIVLSSGATNVQTSLL
ncbi:pilus assembly FimT family protein [Teredinibacter haidensis]|uniref:pilus assembly FimT family protein n=1 Tax=Teredinibacter haidensis TaxID=2731755 RepID=UPI000948E7D7|nr:prepilin-type N-terminal cleavage/methylation domain-containing protein [Teredinibacter haidensis]